MGTTTDSVQHPAAVELRLDQIITHIRLQNRNIQDKYWKGSQEDKQSLKHVLDLKRQIKRDGQQTPVKVVRAEPERGDSYYLVDGHHRFWALGQLNPAGSIIAHVLEGNGLVDALKHAAVANQGNSLTLTQDQRIENAWRNLNLPETDYFRRMNKKQAAETLDVSSDTIKKMRRGIRDEGVRQGQIDPALTGEAAEIALLSYWNENTRIDTWRMFRRDGEQRDKSNAWKVRKARLMLAQTAVNLSEQFSPSVAKEALNELYRALQGTPAREGFERIKEGYRITPQPPEPEDDELDMAGYLEYQRQQSFDHVPAPLYSMDTTDETGDF